LGGNREIEDALLRLDKLTPEEVRMVAIEGLEATRGVDDKVTAVGGKVIAVDGKVTAVDDKVMGVSTKVETMHEVVKSFDDRMKDVGDQVAYGTQPGIDSFFRTILNTGCRQALRLYDRW